MISRAQAARLIDHTLLRPDATRPEIDALVAEAIDLGVYAVCVEGQWVEDVVEMAWGTGLKVVTVCGFPTGEGGMEAKAEEAAMVASLGVDEIDMVADLEAIRQGEWEHLEKEVAMVRVAIDDVAPAGILKVIVETAAFDETAIGNAARMIARGGADFVKTSTGFHEAGGATVEAVRLLRQYVGGRLGIKASGGIRGPAEAAALIRAGATRLGTSRSRDILDGWAGEAEA